MTNLLGIVVVGGIPMAGAALGWLIGWSTGLDERGHRRHHDES